MSKSCKDKTTNSVATLSVDDEIRVVFDFFSGNSREQVIKDHNISPQTFACILRRHGHLSTKDVTFKRLELQKARESDRIMGIKQKAYDLVEKAIEDALAVDEKTQRLMKKDVIENFTKIKDVLGKMDEIFRLNNDLSTQNIRTDSTTRTFDMNEALEKLNTPEEKRRFLQEMARKRVSSN